MNHWVEEEVARRLEAAGASRDDEERELFEQTARLRVAAEYLFDNRLGQGESPKRKPMAYAPREFWADLGEALYGADDPRVAELREPAAAPTVPPKR